MMLVLLAGGERRTIMNAISIFTRNATLALILCIICVCSSQNATKRDTSAAALQRDPVEPQSKPPATQPEPPPVATTGTETATRTEHDLLGEKQIPANAYYGVQTERALENFQISGISID